MSGTGDTAPVPPTSDGEPRQSGGSSERQENDGTQRMGERPIFPNRPDARSNVLSRFDQRGNQGRQRGTLDAAADDDGSRARNALQEAQRERRAALEPLFNRILESGLVNSESWLEDVWEEAKDLPQWQLIDVERYTDEIVEQLQEFLDNQDDEVLLDYDAQISIAAQARRVAARVRDVAADSVAKHVAKDAAALRRVAERLAELLPATPLQPETTGNSKRRMSAASGLDVVVDPLDPAHLAKLPKEDLIRLIKNQKLYLEETLAERDDTIEQYEGEIEDYKATERDLTRRVDRITTDAKKSKAFFEANLKRVAEIAYHRGRKDLVIDGSGPAPPLTNEDERNYEALLRQQGTDTLSPTTPSGQKGPSSLDAPPKDEFEDDRRQYYDDLQALMAELYEESAMSERYIAHIREGVHREALEMTLAGPASLGEAAPRPGTSSSHRTSATASSGSSREQLHTRLRIAEEECDALRAERDRYRAEDAIRSVDELDNLSPASRQRVADISEKSFKLINRVIRLLSRCGRQNSVFANTMVHVARMGEAGDNEETDEVQEALQRVVRLGARIARMEPDVYDQDFGEYGQFEPIEQFQDQWIPQVHAFLDTFNEQYGGLEALRERARVWDAAKPQDEQDRLSGSPQGRGSRRQSISSGSNNQGLLSRAASGLSGLLFGGGEQNRPDDQGPLYTDPNWALLHPDGPCEDCEPVERFPIDDDQDGRDPGLCACGDGAMVEPQSAETTKSSHSGVSRVSFAEANSPPSPAGALSSPTSTKSILRRRPARLDIELANADAGSDVSTRPRTPHPSRSLSGGRSTPGLRRGSDGVCLSSGTPGRPRTPARRHAVVNIPGLSPNQSPEARPPIRRRSTLSTADGTSSSSPGTITDPWQPCCRHHDEESRVCKCGGGCEDHWCCEHWRPIIGCRCDGTCDNHQCCQHFDAEEETCMCFASCTEHTECCSCGVKIQDDGTISCNCDSTCHQHAVCDHYTTDSPTPTCMVGCESLQTKGACDHPQVPGPIDTMIRECQLLCERHPCCEHWRMVDGRIYCACGKGCNAHRCCEHYEMVSDRTCGCGRYCETHKSLGLLKKRRQRDTALTGAPWKTDGNGNVRQGRLSIEVPRRRRRQGRLSPGSSLSGSTPTHRGASGYSCACRCRVRGRQNVLTAGNGQRFAFYICKKGSLRSEPAPSQHSELRSPVDPFVSSAAAFRRVDTLTPPRTESSRRTALSRVSQATKVSRAPSTASVGASSLERLPQDILLPPEHGVEYLSNMLPVGPGGRDSDRPPQGLRPMPPQTPTQRKRRLPRSPRLDFDPEGKTATEPPQDEGVGEEEKQGTVDPPELVPQGEQHQDEQRGQPQYEPRENERRDAEAQPVGAPPDKGGKQASGGQPSARRPTVAPPGETQGSPGRRPRRGGDDMAKTRRPKTAEPEHEPLGPLEELWSMAKTVICFLTWEQVYNAWRIGQYLLGLVYYAGRHNWDRYRKLRGQPALHPWAPVLPIDQIRQLVLWLMIVWFSITMIALQEERRLWLAANPRTARYMRGLRNRDPYPSWSPFQVDYSLLEPAFDRLSVCVHRAVFRPGLATLFGLGQNQLDEAVGNATGLA